MLIYRSGESAGRCEGTDKVGVSCLFIGLGRVLEGVRERIMLTCLAYLFVLRATERQLDVLVNKLRLPKPGKKIARGHIKEEYGPIYKKLPHICIWIYSNADFSDNDFRVSDYE